MREPGIFGVTGDQRPRVLALFGCLLVLFLLFVQQVIVNEINIPVCRLTSSPEETHSWLYS